MSVPVSAYSPVRSGDPIDLSRAAATSQRDNVPRAGFGPSDIGVSNGNSISRAHFDLFHMDFSLADIPLVGDFFAMISSLFSSPSTQPEIPQVAYLPLKDKAVASSLSDAGPAQKMSERASGVRDLSALLSSPVPAPVDLLPDHVTPDKVIDAAADRLPSISGLARHPSNLLPAETLELLQARYAKMTAEEG